MNADATSPRPQAAGEADIYTRSERLMLAATALDRCIREFGDRAPDFCEEYYDAHTRADMALIDDFDDRTDEEREADVERGMTIVNQVLETERLKRALSGAQARAMAAEGRLTAVEGLARRVEEYYGPATCLARLLAAAVLTAPPAPVEDVS